MRIPQLINAALVTAALAAPAACNRAQTEQQTQRAAAEVKTAAAKAGETLADGWVTTRIQAQYFADEQVKARYVDVATHDGVVTVKGFVESPGARERALQIARATSGVKQVNDQLLIGQSPKAFEAASPVATSGIVTPPAPATTRPDDGQVVNTIQAKYFLDGSIKARHIDVDVRDGVVTLRGEVASEAERAQALTLARATDGVVRVEDTLTVNAGLDQGGFPPPPTGTAGSTGTAGTSVTPGTDDQVLTSVKSKLDADAQTKGIEVSVRDGVVLLQGTTTARAKQRALTAARQTDGALQVVDRIAVR